MGRHLGFSAGEVVAEVAFSADAEDGGWVNGVNHGSGYHAIRGSGASNCDYLNGHRIWSEPDSDRICASDSFGVVVNMNGL
jgi:hypothetical protein